MATCRVLFLNSLSDQNIPLEVMRGAKPFQKFLNCQQENGFDGVKCVCLSKYNPSSLMDWFYKNTKHLIQ